MLQWDLGMCWCQFSAWVPGEVYGVHCPSTAFCFVLSWTRRLPVTKHLQADKWEYNWLSMKKKQIYLSVANIDRPLCEPGPSQAKNAGGFKRNSQESSTGASKQQQKGPAHSLEALGTPALRRPDLGLPGPRTNWTGSKWERIPAPLTSTPIYTELFQHTPPQHIQHVLENIHLLTKGGKIEKKNSWKCSYSTGWN